MDKILRTFELVIVSPTIIIFCFVWIYCSLTGNTTQLPVLNKNQVVSQAKSGWKAKIKQIILLIILGIFIVMVYGIIFLIANIGGALSGSPEAGVYMRPSTIMQYISIIILELIPFVLSRSWTLSKKIKYSLIITVIGFAASIS